MLFITTNQSVRTIANPARLIQVLITPSILPTKYIGMKILVAGSSTVNVSTALAPISITASTSSQ